MNIDITSVYGPLRQGLSTIGGIVPGKPRMYLTVGALAGVVYLGARLLSWNWEAEKRIRKIWNWAHVVVDEDDDAADVAKSKYSRVVRITVDHLRSEVGLLSDTKANRIVISELTRKFLKNRGLRPSHISRWFPEIVEAYFLQSPADRMVRDMRRTTFAAKWGRGGESC